MRVLLTNDGCGRTTSWEASVHIESFDGAISTTHIHAAGASEAEARAALQLAVNKLREKLAEELK